MTIDEPLPSLVGNQVTPKQDPVQESTQQSTVNILTWTLKAGFSRLLTATPNKSRLI
jgi:hypothetical protein